MSRPTTPRERQAGSLTSIRSCQQARKRSASGYARGIPSSTRCEASSQARSLLQSQLSQSFLNLRMQVSRSSSGNATSCSTCFCECLHHECYGVCHGAAPVCTGEHERCRGEVQRQSPGRPVDLQPLHMQLIELLISPGDQRGRVPEPGGGSVPYAWQAPSDSAGSCAISFVDARICPFSADRQGAEISPRLFPVRLLCMPTTGRLALTPR